MNDKRILELSDDDLDQVAGGMRTMSTGLLSLNTAGIIPDGSSFMPRDYNFKSFEEAKQDVSNGYGQPTGGWNTARDPVI